MPVLFFRFKLVLGSVVVAIFPPIFCILFTRNIRLTRAQNAVDGKDLAGQSTDEPTDMEVGPISLRHGNETSA